MWGYLWPILMAIGANAAYNVIAKSTPENVDPFASLTVTYGVATIVSLLLFFVTSQNKNLLLALKKANWTAVLFGIALIGLEFGFLNAYRVGWKISTVQLVVSIGVTCVLLFIGLFFYKETLTLRQIAGLVVCLGGLVLIMK